MSHLSSPGTLLLKQVYKYLIISENHGFSIYIFLTSGHRFVKESLSYLAFPRKHVYPLSQVVGGACSHSYLTSRGKTITWITDKLRQHNRTLTGKKKKKKTRFYNALCVCTHLYGEEHVYEFTPPCKKKKVKNIILPPETGSLTGTWTHRLGWPASKPQRSSCVASPALRWQCMWLSLALYMGAQD